MVVKFNLKSGGCSTQSGCVDKFGCPADICPDFTIRRHDTKPALKISVEDCDGPMDLRGLVVEMSMWARARLKKDLAPNIDYFGLADNIGFEQIMVGDIIMMDRVRLPEYMLVMGFDETNKLVQVQRGYRGTTPGSWKKGDQMRIFRVLSAPAESEMLFEDIQQVDGTTDKDVLTASYLVYEWQAEDTCLPGCYWVEFKVLKMVDVVWYLPGGYWVGDYFVNTDGFFYTGLTNTESSVRLSYDQIADKFYLPDTVWVGEFHLYSDGNYYTGIVHNEGSVLLTKLSASTNNPYDDNGIVSSLIAGYNLTDTSIIPSFTDENLTPYYFGCILGEGVEWVRRFPITGEGFLVKIENSFTPEL